MQKIRRSHIYKRENSFVRLLGMIAKEQKYRIVPVLAALFLNFPLLAAQTEIPQFWQLNGKGGITWRIGDGAHFDHLEMAGKRVAVVLRYGVGEDGRFQCNRGMVWPMLRTLPNDTHASLQRQLGWNALEAASVKGRYSLAQTEKVDSISWSGLMTVYSRLSGFSLKHILAPCTDLPAMVELFVLKNTDKKERSVQIDDFSCCQQTPATEGVDGSYRIESRMYGAGTYTLKPGDSIEFSTLLGAWKQTERLPDWDARKEIGKRRMLVGGWMNSLVLKTPDPVLNRMFAFAKIRALESIYQTKGGPMHGPGGEAYYAAIWANDQAEYANPFFPFTGYGYANEAALNSFKHFARFMNAGFKPIPSSIIAEGEGFWNGAGDRGDAAMIAYGAARYALARGNRAEAEQLWPLIEWCLEFCRLKLNDAGVVRSDKDELEGRFPSGSANLCTSALYYDALRSAAFLARDLGKDGRVSKSFVRQAAILRGNIEAYFHANVEGFDTYRYYDGNKVLRSWICIPLTMGIFEHAQGTLDALYSPRLWTKDGMLTQAGDKTFWDRTTLYAFRGALMAGDTERTMGFLHNYSLTRLLGEHVPYAIEAWPEGSQRHLSAESALYARVVTEGLFGIRPTGLRSFVLSPRLPQEWPSMSLDKIFVCGECLNITVNKAGVKVLRLDGKGLSAIKPVKIDKKKGEYYFSL